MSVTLTSTGITFSDGTSQSTAFASTYGAIGTYSLYDGYAGTTGTSTAGSNIGQSGTWLCMGNTGSFQDTNTISHRIGLYLRTA